MDVQLMSYDECLRLIKRQWLARIGCAYRGVPYVVPVQYAYSGDKLYCFTLPGKKLQIMRKNPNVCVQIDRLKSRHAWTSVVVNTRFVDLAAEECREEKEQAWSLLAQRADWWEPGALKPPGRAVDDTTHTHLFFGLEIIDLSGRRTGG